MPLNGRSNFRSRIYVSCKRKNGKEGNTTGSTKINTLRSLKLKQVAYLYWPEQPITEEVCATEGRDLVVKDSKVVPCVQENNKKFEGKIEG